jgi:hypothetical protein
MNHDLRFGARRIELAAILSLAALIGWLALGAPDARAPESSAFAPGSQAMPVMESGEAVAARDGKERPAVCSSVLPDSADCTYY